MADLKPIPDGYPRVSPPLAIAGAAEAIEFYSYRRTRTAVPVRSVACWLGLHLGYR